MLTDQNIGLTNGLNKEKMDRLDEFIDYMEKDLESYFDALLPKDKIAMYLNAKEYQRPKRQRTSIDPNDSELPEDIYTNFKEK